MRSTHGRWVAGYPYEFVHNHRDRQGSFHNFSQCAGNTFTLCAGNNFLLYLRCKCKATIMQLPLSANASMLMW